MNAADYGDRVFGKYEGIVRNNLDPMFGGRLEVEVPAVLGTEKVWARPCVPYAAQNLGLYFTPPTGALVWVEFLGGDTDQPIWSGCYWKNGEIPTRNINEMVLATPGGTVTVAGGNMPPEIRIELKDATSITIRSKSISINSSALGKIELGANGTVVNDGALEVK